MAPSIPATCQPTKILREEQTGWVVKCIMITITVMDINLTWTTTTREINTVQMLMWIKVAMSHPLIITTSNISTTIVLIEMKGKPMLLISITDHSETLTNLIKAMKDRIVKARIRTATNLTLKKINTNNGINLLRTSNRTNSKIWHTTNNHIKWAAVIIWKWKIKLHMANMGPISNIKPSNNSLILTITNNHSWCSISNNQFVMINLAHSKNFSSSNCFKRSKRKMNFSSNSIKEMTIRISFLRSLTNTNCSKCAWNFAATEMF